MSEGIAEDVPKDKKLHGSVINYIPHHAVIVLEKLTPVRVVMDARATVGRTKSLNDNILKGCKWRGNTVASIVDPMGYKIVRIYKITKIWCL